MPTFKITIIILTFVAFFACFVEFIIFLGYKKRTFAKKTKRVSHDAEHIITQRGSKYSLSGDYIYDIGGASHQGMRKYQEDSYYLPNQDANESSSHIIIMCDGMGGMECGDIASSQTVKMLSNEFYNRKNIENIPEFFGSMVNPLDKNVMGIKTADGKVAQAGTTLISAIIKDNQFYWMSIGDSRIYLYRDGKLIQLTRDHNYLLELTEQVKQGLITQEQAYNDPQKNALISFVGMNGVALADISANPIELSETDVLLLCSDGLYNCLTEDEMLNVIRTTNNMKLLSHRLVIEAFDKGFKFQDNTTVVAARRIK